jgi:hypothetical protein
MQSTNKQPIHEKFDDFSVFKNLSLNPISLTREPAMPRIGYLNDELIEELKSFRTELALNPPMGHQDEDASAETEKSTQPHGGPEIS